MKQMLVILVLHVCIHLNAQQFLVNDSTGELVRLDMNACVTESLGFIGSFTDLAAHPDGYMYAISSNGRLLRFNLNTLTSTQVADFNGSQYYALTATSEGTIYAATAGGTLKSYNPFNDELREYPNMGYGAAGDLTYYLGQLYMASTDNTMVSIYPENPALNEVIIDFSTEGVEIFGIVSTLFECQIRTFAISGDPSARIFEIGWEDKTFEEFCSTDIGIYGGSSEFEYKASNEVLYIDNLARKNSLCEIADVTISISGKGIGDSIMYSLDNINFQSSSTFEGLSYGKYYIYMKDELGCEALDSIELGPGMLSAEVAAIENARCGFNNGQVQLSIGSNADSFYLEGYENATYVENLVPGSYNLEVKDTDGCEDSVKFDIEGIPPLELLDLVGVATTCGDNNGALSVEIDKEEARFILNTMDNTTGFFEDLAAGDYVLTILDRDACRIDTSITIASLDECNIFVPSAFSPNEDGFNDTFEIFSDTQRNILETRIFDRWGNEVYKRLNAPPDWYGKYNGKTLSEGSYTYLILLQGGARKFKLSGEVTLLK